MNAFTPIERSLAAHGDPVRDVRVYRYLRDNSGWNQRDRIMHWTGFEKIDRVTEYVQFANCIIRLNAALARHGQVVERNSGEGYRLTEAG